MRQMARKLEKAEQKLDKEAAELEKLRAKMSKMRANCSHKSIEMRGGVVVCKDCLEEVAYAKAHGAVVEDDEYEDEE